MPGTHGPGRIRAWSVAAVCAATMLLTASESASAQFASRGDGLIPASAQIQEVLLPGDLQYTLLAKIFTFDRNLHQRSENEFVVAVVYQNAFPASRAAANDLTEAFEASDIRSVEGLPIRLAMVSLEPAANLADRLRTERADLTYISPLRAVGLRSVLEAARFAGTVTITGVPEYVPDGVAVGLSVDEGTPHILINLTSARDEGADFEASLLSLAEVLQED